MRKELLEIDDDSEYLSKLVNSSVILSEEVDEDLERTCRLVGASLIYGNVRNIFFVILVPSPQEGIWGNTPTKKKNWWKEAFVAIHPRKG